MSRTSPTVPRPVPDLPEGPTAHLGPRGVFPDLYRTSLRVDPSRTYPRSPDSSCTSPRVHQAVRELSEGLPTRPEPPRGSPDPSCTSATVTQPVQDLLDGPPTRPGPPLGSPDPPGPHGGPPTRPGPPQRSPDPYWITPRVPRPVPDLLEGPLTRPRPPRGSLDPSRTSPRVP